jgi:hypothetical protein
LIAAKGAQWGDVKLYANVTLQCSPSTTSTKDYKIVDTAPTSMTEDTLTIQWFSKHFCGKLGKPNGSGSTPGDGSGSPGMGVGGVLWMIFVIFILFYVIGGMVFNFYINKIRTFPEILPNYTFWVDVIEKIRGLFGARQSYVRI